MSLRFEVISTLGQLSRAIAWYQLICGKAYFFNYAIFEASREMFFVGRCPTIEIVGLGLKRCVATGEVVFVGSVPRLKSWA